MCAIECLTTESRSVVTATGIIFVYQHVMDQALNWTVCKCQPTYTASSSLQYVLTTNFNVEALRVPVLLVLV